MQRLQLEGVQMLTWWRGSCSGWHGSCWQLGWGLLALRWVGSGGQLPTGQLKVLTEGCGALFGATAIATAWVPSTVAQYVAHHSHGPIMVCTRWNIVCVCYTGIRGCARFVKCTRQPVAAAVQSCQVVVPATQALPCDYPVAVHRCKHSALRCHPASLVCS